MAGTSPAMTVKVMLKANRASCQECSDEAIQARLCAHNYTKIASSFLILQ